VAMFVMLTSAFGTGARCASMTTPDSEPVLN
jgi:hypothetical protein